MKDSRRKEKKPRKPWPFAQLADHTEGSRTCQRLHVHFLSYLRACLIYFPQNTAEPAFRSCDLGWCGFKIKQDLIRWDLFPFGSDCLGRADKLQEELGQQLFREMHLETGERELANSEEPGAPRPAEWEWVRGTPSSTHVKCGRCRLLFLCGLESRFGRWAAVPDQSCSAYLAQASFKKPKLPEFVGNKEKSKGVWYLKKESSLKSKKILV